MRALSSAGRASALQAEGHRFEPYSAHHTSLYGNTWGRLAQLGEHLPYKQRVIGSSPIVPTIFGPVVQLVRMPACHAGGRGFEPHPDRHAAPKVQHICLCSSVGRAGD